LHRLRIRSVLTLKLTGEKISLDVGMSSDVPSWQGLVDPHRSGLAGKCVSSLISCAKMVTNHGRQTQRSHEFRVGTPRHTPLISQTARYLLLQPPPTPNAALHHLRCGLPSSALSAPVNDTRFLAFARRDSITMKILWYSVCVLNTPVLARSLRLTLRP